EATKGQQTPETKPEINNDTIAKLAENGPKFTAPWEPLSEEDLQGARRGSGDASSAPPALPPPPPRLPANPWEEQFDEAIRLGRILPGKAGSAFDMLQRLDRRDAQYPDYQNQLRVALEEAGQKVIGTY